MGLVTLSFLNPAHIIMLSCPLIDIYNNLYVILLVLTAVNCGNLTDPADGQVNHTAGTTFRQTATYSCNTGYSLVEDNTRTCQATGTWSGSAPTCQGMGDLTLFICAYAQET